MPRTLALVISSLMALTNAGAAASSPADEAAIRQIERVWDDGWNRHDAKMMASVLAEDVDFVNVAGRWLKGRAAFQEHMERFHAEQFAQSTRMTTDTEIKFLTPEIAVVHSGAKISGDRAADGSLQAPRNVLMTRVVMKRGGKWVVVAAHNTNVTSTSPAK